MVGEDLHGLAVHVHDHLVDAGGVQLPGLGPGEEMAGLVEQLAGGGVDHRLRQGPLRGAHPQGQLLVELIAPHHAQIVAAGVEEQAVDEGLGGVHRGGLAGAQLAVNLQQRLLIALAGVLLQGGQDGGVVAEEGENLRVGLHADGADQAGDGQLAVFVDAHPEQLVGVGLVLQPGAPLGDDLGGEDGQVGLDVGLLAVVHAGGADDLGDHHALGAVDDKGAGLGHQREIAHEDLLLLDLLSLLVAQAHADLQGRGIVHVPGLALLHVVLGGLVHAVVDEAQLQGAGVVADDAHVGEHLPQPRIQEPLVGGLLNLQQVGHGHDLLMPGKILSQRFAVILVFRHLVTLICLSALPRRHHPRVPRAATAGPPAAPAANAPRVLKHTGKLILLWKLTLAFFVENCYTVPNRWRVRSTFSMQSTLVYHFMRRLSRKILQKPRPGSHYY